MAKVFLYPVSDSALGPNTGSTLGSPHYRSVDEPYNAPDSDYISSSATADDGNGEDAA